MSRDNDDDLGAFAAWQPEPPPTAGPGEVLVRETHYGVPMVIRRKIAEPRRRRYTATAPAEVSEA